MAVIMVLAGGILGFVAGLISLFGLGFGLIASVGIWSATGIVIAIAGIAVTMLQRDQRQEGQTRVA